MKLECVRGRAKEYADPISGRAYYSHSQVARVIWPDPYAGVDDAVLEFARQRGVDLHRIFFFLLASLRGFCPRPARPAEFGGYYDAMVKFVRERKPYPVLIEEPSKNDKLGVAGTVDTKCVLDDVLSLVDLKTGREEKKPHKFQLNLYKSFEEYKDARKLWVLYVHDDGDYDLKPVPNSPLAVAMAQNAVSLLKGRDLL
jgi:hypothetical protein